LALLPGDFGRTRPRGAVLRGTGAVVHELCGETEIIGEMRQFVGFYTKCFHIARRGLFKFANSYSWFIGALIDWAVLSHYGYEMEIPSNIPGAVMAFALFFLSAGLFGFLFRMIFVAPFQLLRRSEENNAALRGRLEQQEARLQEIMAPPDFTVMTDHAPLVFEREAVPEATGGLPGTLIVFREVRIINRSNRNLSIQCKLKLWLVSSFYYAVDQIPATAVGTLNDEGIASAIGRQLPDVINVAGPAVESGSLAFFVPNDDENVRRTVFLALLRRFPKENVGDTISELRKEIEIIDLLSGLRAECDATVGFSYTSDAGARPAHL
jgi:hypothetical protein